MGKESSCNAGDVDSIPGSGRSPGGGHGNPLQYSCLQNPTARGAWWATVHGVTKSQQWLKWLRCTSTYTSCNITLMHTLFFLLLKIMFRQLICWTNTSLFQERYVSFRYFIGHSIPRSYLLFFLFPMKLYWVSTHHTQVAKKSLLAWAVIAASIVSLPQSKNHITPFASYIFPSSKYI